MRRSESNLHTHTCTCVIGRPMEGRRRRRRPIAGMSMVKPWQHRRGMERLKEGKKEGQGEEGQEEENLAPAFESCIHPRSQRITTNEPTKTREQEAAAAAAETNFGTTHGECEDGLRAQNTHTLTRPTRAKRGPIASPVPPAMPAARQATQSNKWGRSSGLLIPLDPRAAAIDVLCDPCVVFGRRGGVDGWMGGWMGARE